MTEPKVVRRNAGFGITVLIVIGLDAAYLMGWLP